MVMKSSGGGGDARLLTAILFALHLRLGAGACPCQDPALCKPISSPRDFEVFVFDVGGKTWKNYNWSLITTVATFGKYDPELMCYAHSKGSRVVLKDRRCYNYTGIADSCDFVFVMSYDEQSQVWSHCIARANAPYNQTLAGYDNYIFMGINQKKLVMGVPWYGYDYTCQNLSKTHECILEKIPFRGAPCSDAAGRQVPYKTIMTQVNSSLSGILWDEEQKAPYLEYKDSHGGFHQVWFDDPRSISLKTAYVKKHGLRGIGMWNANCLEYSGSVETQQETEEMWDALLPK
ncbi:hypothetical protein Chor_003523 [Crotalus horridus]